MTEHSETSAHNIQASGTHPKEITHNYMCQYHSTVKNHITFCSNSRFM